MRRCGQLTIALSIALCAQGLADAPLGSADSTAVGAVPRRVSGREPGTLDPRRNEESRGAQTHRDLYEGRTRETVDARVVPGIAESWTISDGRLVYTFSVWSDARGPTGDGVVAGMWHLAGSEYHGLMRRPRQHRRSQALTPSARGAELRLT